MNAPDWLAAYAQRLGVPAPSKDELKAVLDLAGEAAHRSQRIAAPVACWLAARAGVDLQQAIRLARETGGEQAEAGGEPAQAGGGPAQAGGQPAQAGRALGEAGSDG
ncbi:MAG TPA: DUF6457 domain-containing protein [Solirubrobacteraceae bacterium]|nr:DUF6457 domain-containing protein [Solirubrobacteraceae bacterium]